MQLTKFKIKNNKSDGQVMLLTVLFLATIFLSATIIAGSLMVSQVSQTAKVADSAKAIFAADTAIERAEFKIFRCNDPTAPDQSTIAGTDVCLNAGEPLAPDASNKLPVFFDNASYQLLITTDPGCPSNATHDPNALPSAVVCVKSIGRTGKVARAFGLDFQ